MQALIIHQGRILNNKIEEFKNLNKFDRIDKVNLKLSERKVIEDDFNYDKFCHEELKKEVTRIYDLIIIHLNLSDNDYGEMYGLRVACHLRLTKDFCNTKSQIIILSSDTHEDILRMNSFGSVLLTPGVQLSSQFDFTFEFRHSPISDEQYDIFLKKINFPNPDTSDNRHSIANELSLYLWSKSIGLDLNELDGEISTNLYYKWVSLIQRDLTSFDSDGSLQLKINDKAINSQLNIVLIDDQADKGWESFYRKIFKLMDPSEKKIKFNNISIKKGLTREQIVSHCLNEIQNKLARTPHIVLLDLRLVDSDFNSSTDDAITGIQIAEKIAAYNEAIQIIFTTASNKITSYVSASKGSLGVDGYIIKSPFDDIENSILNIVDNIINAHEKSKFLQSVQDKMTSILNLFPETNSTEYKENHDFFKQANSSLATAFKILYNYGKDEVLMNYAYFHLFLIIEKFVDRKDVILLDNSNITVSCSSDSSKSKKLFIGELKKRTINGQTREDLFYRKINLELWSTHQVSEFGFAKDTDYHPNELDRLKNKIYLVLWFKYKMTAKNMEWSDLNQHRNDIGHGEDVLTDEVMILRILDFIKTILNTKEEKM